MKRRTLCSRIVWTVLLVCILSACQTAGKSAGTPETSVSEDEESLKEKIPEKESSSGNMTSSESQNGSVSENNSSAGEVEDAGSSAAATSENIGKQKGRPADAKNDEIYYDKETGDLWLPVAPIP